MKEQSVYTLYNTGDQVWREWQNGKWVVVRVETHDGIVSDENGMTKMVGLEKSIHDMEVKALRVLHAALYR